MGPGTAVRTSAGASTSRPAQPAAGGRVAEQPDLAGVPGSLAFGERARRRARRGVGELLAAALALIALLLTLSGHATAEPGQTQAPSAPLPVLVVIPSEDGQAVLVQASGVGQLGGQVFTSLQIGPSANKGSYTMTYSDTGGLYQALVPGFSAGQSPVATLGVTSTGGLQSEGLALTRGFLPDGQGSVSADDDRLRLDVLNLGALPADTYIAANASPAAPGPPPAGLALVGRSYSVRASGGLTTSLELMSLRLSYRPADLGAADPTTLAIFAWDPVARAWVKLPSSLFAAQGYVSAQATAFTFYGLFAAAPPADKVRVFLPLISR